MNNRKLSTGLLALLIAATVLACKPTPAGSAENGADAASAKTAKTAPAVAEQAKPDPAAAEPSATEPNAGASPTTGSTVMDQPLDGTSTESFEQSLAQVREKATSYEAKKLDSAIQYLLVYDLAVKNDKTKLYAKLNGKTPNEVITSATRR